LSFASIVEHVTVDVFSRLTHDTMALARVV